MAIETKFKRTVSLMRKLPGVGPRQAARFVLALLERPESELQELGLAIRNLKQDISFCTACYNLSDNALCQVCANPARDSSKVLIVEKVTDLDSIEKTGLYRGLYHVLGGAISPLDNILPEHLKIKELQNRIASLTSARSGGVELILATNPNTAGETTALYLKELFSNAPGITVTRLGRGLASGSHLEYADESTLKNALEFRS